MLVCTSLKKNNNEFIFATKDLGTKHHTSYQDNIPKVDQLCKVPVFTISAHFQVIG